MSIDMNHLTMLIFLPVHHVNLDGKREIKYPVIETKIRVPTLCQQLGNGVIHIFVEFNETIF